MPTRLALCLDGTWNSTFNSVEREDGTKVLKPTNPLKLSRVILPVDQQGNRQITYYDSGVGAIGVYPGIANRLLQFCDSKLGGAWGAGFEANIEQAANFIAVNYSEDTEVFIFGFSRGASQARGLTNFLSWLGGITPKNDVYYLPLLFQHYLTTRGSGDPRDINDSKNYVPADNLLPLKVKLLGVFDTVTALGSRLRATKGNSTEDRGFHVRKRPADCVLNARQALAIDEERYDFRPEIWTGASHASQSLEQRWFAGVHANVGGSYGDDGLANCALQWIADEAAALGLEMDQSFLKKYREYPGDQMGHSYTAQYKLMDALRLKSGKGRRALHLDWSAANISVDPYAIRRLCLDPSGHERMDGRYRPHSLVELARQHNSDPVGFVQSYGLDPQKYPFPSDLLPPDMQ